MKLRFSELAAWAVMLTVSAAPDILWHRFTGLDAQWTYWIKLDVAGAAALAGFLWRPMRSLRDFAVILFAVLLAQGIPRLGGAAADLRYGATGEPFTWVMLSHQLLRLAGTILVIGALLSLGYRRRDFFLARGQVRAPSRPMVWLGFPRSVPWTRFGGWVAVYVAAGMLVFLVIAGHPAAGALRRIVPVLPAVLPLAALNAFSEEMTFRAPLLATLEGPIGRRHALWISAAFFGIGHYGGVPYGAIGVLIGTFLGWLLGRAMLETRGLFWAWFIHFVLDVLVFTFMASGAIRPGG